MYVEQSTHRNNNLCDERYVMLYYIIMFECSMYTRIAVGLVLFTKIAIEVVILVVVNYYFDANGWTYGVYCFALMLLLVSD